MRTESWAAGGATSVLPRAKAAGRSRPYSRGTSVSAKGNEAVPALIRLIARFLPKGRRARGPLLEGMDPEAIEAGPDRRVRREELQLEYEAWREAGLWAGRGRRADFL